MKKSECLAAIDKILEDDYIIDKADEILYHLNVVLGLVPSPDPYDYDVPEEVYDAYRMYGKFEDEEDENEEE